MTKAIREAAIHYADVFGWFVVPTLKKAPVGGNDWPNRASCEAIEVHRAFNTNSRDGVGVVLGTRSGIVDIECDDEIAERTYAEIFGEQRTPTFKSTRGLHRIFRHRDGLPSPEKSVFKIGNLEFRTGNGGKAAQTVFPPSGNREWLIHPDDCQPAEITDEVLAKIVSAVEQNSKPKRTHTSKPRLSPSESRVKRARAYLATIPPAVSGQKGHDQTFKAACKLRSFGLDRGEMLDLLSEWNQSCDPPWGDHELEHKVDDAIAADPEPMPDRNTSPLGVSPVVSSGTPAGVNESADDPHRLGRLFINQNFKLQNGLQKLAFWQGAFWRWDGLRWIELKKHELIAMLTACIKAEFDRVNLWQLENWMPQTEGEEPPKVKPVTKWLLTNVENAVASIVVLPDYTTMPDWLCGDPPFPAREVLSTKSTLLHLPSLISGKPSGISPTPMLFSANALTYDYDQYANCPTWRNLMESIWPDDPESIEALQEWFGYLLLPDTRQHKILMLIGPPRSGKGTIARVLQQLLGQDNVASPTLSSLAGPFGLWPLLNKYVALVPDARLSGRDDAVAVVERILSISGEDPQDVHRKNQPTLTGVRMPTRFVLMSNELPNMKDASGAFMTRVVLLRMTQSFIGREDRTLSQRLSGELPGILNWAAEGWRRLHYRGYFTQPGSATELLDDLENICSPIRQFIADSCVIGPAHESTVEQLFRAWEKWCETNHREHKGTTQSLGRDLRAALPHLKKVQRRDGFERVRGYVGIAVNPIDCW